MADKLDLDGLEALSDGTADCPIGCYEWCCEMSIGAKALIKVARQRDALLEAAKGVHSGLMDSREDIEVDDFIETLNQAILSCEEG